MFIDYVHVYSLASVPEPSLVMIALPGLAMLLGRRARSLPAA